MSTTDLTTDHGPRTTDHGQTPAIELRNVSLSFDEKRVLSDISFKLSSGGTLFLLGVTGSGKSVLLKLILGLLKPDAGEILVEGRNVVSLPESELLIFRKNLGIVFQEGALFDSLSVYENVSYRLHEEGECDEDRIEKRVREVLTFVDMQDAIDKRPAELSGGMRRRVSIARAIISQPSIMLYDSPTGGLDPVTAHTINVLIAKLRDTQHATSVVVTQRLQDAAVLVSHLFSAEREALVPAGDDKRGPEGTTNFLILREGKIYYQGTHEELAHTRDSYLRRFLS
jgi:phospholipid/cholesterol/gamma-HCH transport system ATP-binding protein